MKLVQTLFCAIWLVLVIQNAEIKPVATFITGYWADSNRQYNDIKSPVHSYKEYLTFFKKTLENDCNLIIFGNQQTESYIKAMRIQQNTVFILKEDGFLNNEWFSPILQANIVKMQKQLTNPLLMKQFKDSKHSLPLMYSKINLMQEALSYDIFNSTFFIWINPGIIHQNKKYSIKTIQQLFLATQQPWILNTQQKHSRFQVSYKQANRFDNQSILSNYFGGRVQVISTVKNSFEMLLKTILESQQIPTDQDVLNMMRYKYPLLFPFVHNIQLKHLYNRFYFNQPLYLPTKEVRYFDFTEEIAQPFYHVITTSMPRTYENHSQIIYKHQSPSPEVFQLLKSNLSYVQLSFYKHLVYLIILVILYLKIIPYLQDPFQEFSMVNLNDSL